MVLEKTLESPLDCKALSFPAISFSGLGLLGSSPIGSPLSPLQGKAVLTRYKLLGSPKSWHQAHDSCYPCLFSGGKVKPLDKKKGELKARDLKDSRGLGAWQSETIARKTGPQNGLYGNFHSSFVTQMVKNLPAMQETLV